MTTTTSHRIDTETVTAISHLSHWAKHGSHASWSRRAIYEIKREAAYAAFLDGAACRQVAVSVKCRDCGGSGRYTDINGFQHSHCWSCSNSGTVRLDFVETRMPDGVVWHTPRHLWIGWPHSLRDVPHGLTDWTPNQPGEADIDVADVARMLTVADRWYWYSGAVPENRQRSHAETTLRYRLHIGTLEGFCAFCGLSIQSYPTGAICDPVHWYYRRCDICAAFGRTMDKPPHELLRLTYIREWILQRVKIQREFGRLLRTQEHATDIPF